MAVTDSLGRNISEGIDQSAFIKQMAESLRTQDVLITKTSDHTEEISSGSGKLPQEIANKIRAAFEDDMTKAVSYLEVIKKFCEDKEKNKSANKKDDGVIDAITALGDKLLSHFSSGGADTTGVAGGFITANAHLAAIAGSTSITANACNAMAVAFLHKGSGYTHDIHCESILSEIQKDIRVIGTAITSKNPVTFNNSETPSPTKIDTGGSSEITPSSVEESFEDQESALRKIVGLSGLWNAQMKELEGRTEKLSGLLGVDRTTTAQLLRDAREKEFLTADELQNINILLVKAAKLSDHEKRMLQAAGKSLLVHQDSEKVFEQILHVADAQIDRFGKLKSLQDAIAEDAKIYAREFIRTTSEGLAGGLKTSQIFHGIWGGQIDHNKDLHEALYITQGLNAGLDAQRQQYMKLGREASAVAETGENILVYQKAYLSNMKSGIKDAMTLSRVTRAALGTAQATGMNAEQTAKSFGQWNMQLGMSSNQLYQVGRAVKFAAQATGLMGDELAQALETAKELANEMRNAGTLTANAVGAFAQFSAASKKFGVDKSLMPILKSMSSSIELLNNSDDKTRSLLFKAAGSVDRVADLVNGTVMNSEEGRKAMGQGLKNVLNSFLAGFGKDISQINQLTDEEKMVLNRQLEAAHGRQLGEFQKTIEAYDEGTKTINDKIGDITKQLQNNLTQQERQALLDQKRGLELQQLLGGLTKLDEAAMSAKTMADALKSQNMTQDQLRKQLTETIANVNGALSKAGKEKDMIDSRRIESALKDPTQYRDLLAGINAAEQKSQVAAKAAVDPVLGAQQKMNELQGKVVENTGKIAEQMVSFLGPRGVLAMMLLNGFINSGTGILLVNKALDGIQNSLLASRGTSNVASKLGPVGSAGEGSIAGRLGATGKTEMADMLAATGKTGPGSIAVNTSNASKMAANATATTAMVEATSKVGLESAKSATLMSRMGAGISSVSAALLPLIKIVAIVGGVILAFMALVQGLQKAFENIGFDMGELSAIGQKVWEIIKKLWNGLTTLLGVALIPLAYTIKFLTKAISWLLDKINSLLDYVGLGSNASAATTADESPTAAAEATGGAAASGEAQGGTLNTKKQQSATVDALDTQPIKMIEKNLKDTNANLPDNKKMIGNIMSIFGWLAGFSIAIGLFAVLASYFTVTAGQVILAAIVFGVALIALVLAISLLTYGLALSFKLLSRSIDFLASTWESLNMWGQIVKFLAVAFEILAWTAAFVVALTIWTGLSLAIGIAALAIGVLASAVMLAFSLFSLAIALFNVILALSLKALIGSMNMLSETVNDSNIWGALSNYISAMYGLIGFTVALTAALTVWSVFGALVVFATFIISRVFSGVMLAFSAFNFALSLLNVILSVSLMALVASMNFLTSVINDSDLWGTLSNYLGSMYSLLGWIGALTSALALWATFGILVGIMAIIVGAATAIVMTGLSMFLLGIAFMTNVLALSVMAITAAFERLDEAVSNLPATEDIWETMLNLYAWIKDMQILMSYLDALSTGLVTYGLWWYLIGTNFADRFNNAIRGISRSFMKIDMASALMIEKHLDFIDDLPDPKEVKDRMIQLRQWIAEMQNTMVLLDLLSENMKQYGTWWWSTAAAFTARFNNAIEGISTSFTGIDKRAVSAIEEHLSFIDDLPKSQEIMGKMIELKGWIQRMQTLMIDLDGLSLMVKEMYDKWQAAPGNFSKNFNLAIDGISRNFLGIDRGSILAIEEHLKFIDDLPKADDIKSQMVQLKEWLQTMQKVMIELDGLSVSVKAMYDTWQAAPGNFSKNFNLAIDGITRNFNGINAAGIQEIEKIMTTVDDGINAVKPGDVLATMILLKSWLIDMGVVLDYMNESFNQSYKLLRRHISKGMQFRDRLNEIMNGLKSIMDSMQTGILAGIGNGFKSSVIDNLPSADKIWKTYKEVGWYIRNVSAIFPQMAEDVNDLKKVVKPYLNKGDKFAKVFGEITEGIKNVMDKMTTEMLAGIGKGFKVNVIDSLPSADQIWKTYKEVGWYIRNVSAIFPTMAKDVAELEKMVSAPLKDGAKFAKTFGGIVGSVKVVMDQLSTELLRNLGNKFKSNVVDSLPTPTAIKANYEEISKYIKKVAAIFPDMATDVKALQRDTRNELNRGDEFAKTFARIAGGIKNVMDQMSTELLKGLGGNWKNGVISQLPTAEMIQAIWDNKDARKGVKAYIISVAKIFPQMATEIASLEKDTLNQLNSGKAFGETLQRILTNMRMVFENMNTGLLRGLGGRWQVDIVSKLPTSEIMESSWSDIKEYIVDMAEIFPTMAKEIAAIENKTLNQLNSGKVFGETLQRILTNMRMVFENMNTGLLRGIGGRWQANVIGKLPTPKEIWAIWDNPDAGFGIKAYLKAVAELFPKLEADINTWKETVSTQLEAGGRFGASLTRIMEQITGVFGSIKTTLMQNMGSFGRDVSRGFVSKLPPPAQIKEALKQLENWLTGTASIISTNLQPMVTNLESTLTPKITSDGVAAAEALKGMIGAVGDIFRRISVVGLQSAFASFSKKTVNSLPTQDDLLGTFMALETWIKAVVSDVLPKLTRLTADLKGALESQLNRGVAISRDFGSMVKMIADIFENIKLTELARSVRGFVKSWGQGLPPAKELSNIMDQLVNWMKDVFGDAGPMSIMKNAMTQGPLSNIGVIAEAIRKHAATMAEAIASITETFKAIDPSRAIRAIEKLQKLGGRKMPTREEVITAIERVQTFVADASAALHRNAEGVTGTDKALGVGQAKATSFISTSATNADPTGTTVLSGSGSAEMSLTRPSQNNSTVQTQIGQRLAGAEPPAGISAANQQLGEIATNTRQMAENQQETNRILAAVLGALSSGGSSSSSGSDAYSTTNVQPGSTPLFPGLRRGFNQGAQKRRVNMS